MAGVDLQHSAPVPEEAGSPPGRTVRPPLNFTRRGSKAAALQAAAEPHSRTVAMEAFVRDQLCAGGAEVRDSKIRTWEELHRAWFAGASSGAVIPRVMPLTAESIAGVGALLKAGHYRSGEDYLSKVKDQHVAFGHPWTDQLCRAARAFGRSVTRGIGPAKQAATSGRLSRSSCQLSRLLMAARLGQGSSSSSAPCTVSGR